MEKRNWTQGVVLMTPTTRRFTPEQMAEAQARENRAVFADFSAMDEGRSRRLVGTFERPEDAAFAALAPEMLAALKECLAAEKERRAKLKPGAPATTYTEARIAKIESVIAKAEACK